VWVDGFVCWGGGEMVSRSTCSREESSTTREGEEETHGGGARGGGGGAGGGGLSTCSQDASTITVACRGSTQGVWVCGWMGLCVEGCGGVGMGGNLRHAQAALSLSVMQFNPHPVIDQT